MSGQQLSSEPSADAAPAKGTFMATCAAAIANNAYMSLAVLVVLVILVIGLWVYYRGLFGFGPYASPSKAGKKAAAEGDGDSDPETERLIETINRK
jgi:hypothetical protein